MKFSSVNDLYLSLKLWGVPVDQYGTGDAKTVDQLYDEIQSGETKLLYDDGVLIRYFRGVIVYVYYGAYKLHEDRQEFSDGRVRRRGFDFLAEKLSGDEVEYFAVHRCLEEEIGVTDVKPLFKYAELRANADAMSYPGIPTLSELSYFDAILPTESFVREGYVEVQPSKTNYYVWHVDRQRLKPEVGIKSSELLHREGHL
jgi:hypothetical protein